MDDLINGLIEKLALNGVGFAFAALFAAMWMKERKINDRFASSAIKAALAQSQDALRHERSNASIRESVEILHKRRRPKQHEE